MEGKTDPPQSDDFFWFVDDSRMLTSAVVKGSEPVSRLMSYSRPKKLCPPRQAVPKEIKHGLDYSPLHRCPLSAVFFYTSHAESKFLTLREKRRRRRRRKYWQRGGVKRLLTSWLTPLRHSLLTHRFPSLSLFLTASLGSSSLYLSVCVWLFLCPSSPSSLAVSVSLSSISLHFAKSFSQCFHPLPRSAVPLSFHLSSSCGGVMWGNSSLCTSEGRTPRTQPWWHHATEWVALIALFVVCTVAVVRQANAERETLHSIKRASNNQRLDFIRIINHTRDGQGVSSVITEPLEIWAPHSLTWLALTHIRSLASATGHAWSQNNGMSDSITPDT